MVHNLYTVLCKIKDTADLAHTSVSLFALCLIVTLVTCTLFALSRLIVTLVIYTLFLFVCVFDCYVSD